MEAFASVSEGFASRIDSYIDAGVTHYFYCPADDRYCNRWGWKIMYNDGERYEVRQLMSICREKKMEFVWTLNPSEGYSWSRNDYDHLLNKLILMYYNGIRHFALCLPQDERTAAIADVLKADLAVRLREKVFIYVVNQMPVVSYPSETEVAQTLMKGYHFDSGFRKAAADSGSILCRLTVNDGFISIPIAASMDYARNPDAYQPDRSIADGIKTMDRSVKDAFLTFLRHTGGDDESSDIEVFTLGHWSQEKSDRLHEEFSIIEKVPSVLESAGGTEIIDALKPWLTEFGRLGARGRRTIECLDHYKKGELAAFWVAYVGNQMSEEDRISYEMHPVGMQKLHPFCMSMMKELAEDFSRQLDGDVRLNNMAMVTSSSGRAEFRLPDEVDICRLLTGVLPEDEIVFFRQFGKDGNLIAEFIIKSTYSEFPIKEGAVVADVLGNVDIYESIFVNL